MDCRVVVEAAVPVYDVATADEAVRIAISKTGDMLNPDLNYVEISMGERQCPNCGEPHDPAFIAADEGLVALELEMTVFNVERKEHASRIARKEIGQRMRNIPLEILDVRIISDEDDEENENEHERDGDDEKAEASNSSEETDKTSETGKSGDETDVLPEFEDLLDE